jgi:hypothetical protein
MRFPLTWVLPNKSGAAERSEVAEKLFLKWLLLLKLLLTGRLDSSAKRTI